MTTPIDYSSKIKPLLKKFKDGDHITDCELNDLIAHFKLLEKLLESEGERYHFCWRNTYDNLRRALDMRNARKNH